MWKQRAIVVAFSAVAVISTGDRRSIDVRCQSLFALKDYAMTLRTCEAAFALTGDPRSGLIAARAAFRLERYDAALLWPTRLRGTPQEATAWELAATIHTQRHEDRLAKSAYLAALQLYRSSNSLSSVASCLYGLYFLSWRASEHRDAFTYATEAYEAASRADDRENQVAALQGLFNAVYEIGDRDTAARVLDLLRPLIEPEDREARAWLTMQDGLLHLSNGNNAAALSSFEDALALVGSRGRDDFVVPVHLNAVQAAVLLGDLDRAEHHLVLAQQGSPPDPNNLNRIGALGFYASWVAYERRRFEDAADIAMTALLHDVSQDWRWQLDFRLARAQQARGYRSAAEQGYERAINGLEQLRAAAAVDDFKEWLIARRRQPYEALFELNVSRGDYAGALLVAERAKARAFYDAFVESASPAPASDARIAKANFSGVADRFDALRSLMPAPGESPSAALPALPELLRAAAGRHVLAYFQANEALWSLSISGRTIEGRRLGQAHDIRRLATRLVGRPDDYQLAAELGRLLLPESQLPPDGSTLYVIPDGALGALSFASLRLGDRWVVERWAISYLPSVSTLAAISQPATRRAGPPVILGDPGGDLPEARKESEWVASLVGVTADVGGSATRARLAHASSSRLLHVAAHTWLAPGGPWLGLADGSVNASAILHDRIRPDIAVLASCAGAASRGGGYWGSWGAAFLAAGVHSVVASLWSVSDAQSREFVRRFYENGGDIDPAGALARAQRGFIEDGRPPTFWAPFVHLGLNGSRP